MTGREKINRVIRSCQTESDETIHKVMRAAQTESKEKLMMKREHNGSRNQEMRGADSRPLHTRNTYDENEKGVIILKLATH
jgi:hypothetical protein